MHKKLTGLANRVLRKVIPSKTFTVTNKRRKEPKRSPTPPSLRNGIPRGFNWENWGP